MAILTQSSKFNHPFAAQLGETLPPVGTYVATVLDVKDVFGIVRPKFQSQEMETVDLTAFLFGFRDSQGNPHRVASRQMRISGNEKSALFKFLTSLLGREPEYGWDYITLKGHKCTLSVQHTRKRDGSGVFASIASVGPLLANPQPAPQPPQPQAPVAPVRAATPTPAPQPVPTAPPAEEDVPF